MTKKLLLVMMVALVTAFVVGAGADFARGDDGEVQVICPGTVVAGAELRVNVTVRNDGRTQIVFDTAGTALGGNASSGGLGVSLGVYGPFVRHLSQEYVVRPGRTVTFNDLLIGTVPSDLSGMFAWVSVFIIDHITGKWCSGDCIVEVQ